MRVFRTCYLNYQGLRLEFDVIKSEFYRPSFLSQSLDLERRSLRTDASRKLQLRATIIGKHRVRTAIRGCISRHNASTVLIPRYIITEFPGPSNPARIAGHNCARNCAISAILPIAQLAQLAFPNAFILDDSSSRIFLREIDNSSSPPTRPSKFARDAIM